MRSAATIAAGTVKPRRKLQKDHIRLYLLFLPVAVWYIVFQYVPMGGLVIAFQDFKILKGIGASKFVGLENFTYPFSIPSFLQAIRNTLIMAAQRLVFSFPLPILFALLLNEVQNPRMKKAAQTMSTVVYYQDNYGYLVPVMCKVAYEDGIAKATLKMMVQSPENDMNAARLGLRTVLPENTTFDLDISDGLARIDLGKEVLNMADAAAESNMITAIVQALTEFESVERVEFLVGGQKLDKLTHGTDISKTFERGEINLESSVSTINSGELKPVMLYFPC